MPSSWSELRFAFGITRREYQLGVRNPAFWGLAVVGALSALWRGSAAGASLALACYQVVQLVVLGLGVVAVLLGGAAAGRDLRDRAVELVLAKPAGSRPLLVVSRFLGVWLSLVTVVVVMLLAVALGQLLSGGTPWRLSVYGNALARCLAPLGLAAAVGYTLTTIFASPLAAALAGVYWVAVPLAREHVPTVFDVTVAQHWSMAALFAAGLLGYSACQHGKSIAGAPRYGVALLTAALLAGGALAVAADGARGLDALTNPNPILTAISHQSPVSGSRAPGFWLPERGGKLVGLSDYQGRPVLLAFWGPSSPESAQILGVLKTLAARYRDRLHCVAVCVDRDSATLAPFAREAGPEVAMLWDRGTHFAPGQLWANSPAATAYAVEQAPTLFLIGPDRRLVQTVTAADAELLAAVISRFVEQP